jgi:glycosyltransferase involved in cell wall biosynthesis
MTTPSISVCILSYNYGRYLGQAIDSALNQQPGKYRLDEIAVIDDGSTDNTLDVCAGYGERITVMPFEHRGFATTLTEAVRQAQGGWVALLDADDSFAPNKLATVAAAMTPDCLLVQHWEHVVKADGSALLDRPHPGGNTSTLVVNRDAALDLLPVTNEVFFHVFDYLGRGVKVIDPLTYYRVHDSNMTDRTRPGVWQDYLGGVSVEVTERLRALAKDPPPWADARSLRRLAWHFAATASGHAREAAVQRHHRGPAIRATTSELVRALMARREISARMTGLRSVLTMRLTAIVGSRPPES